VVLLVLQPPRDQVIQRFGNQHPCALTVLIGFGESQQQGMLTFRHLTDVFQPEPTRLLPQRV